MANNQDEILKWDAKQIFELKGFELELTLNILKAVIATEEAQKYIAVYELIKLYDDKLKKGVEEGNVRVEKTEENKKLSPVK